MELEEKLRYSGTLVNYFFVCKRKLWLFAHQISFEKLSDTVALGKFLSEASYGRREKEVRIDDTISIDWIDYKHKVLHEVKKSPRLDEAHKWQVKYYLYYLEQKGARGFKAEINYPKHHKIDTIELGEADRIKLKEASQEIERILAEGNPPQRIKIPACRRCSYFEFCWV